MNNETNIENLVSLYNIKVKIVHIKKKYFLLEYFKKQPS